MYLTFDEYTQMGGALPAPEFSRYEFRARALVNGATNSRFSKLSELPEELKWLIFEMVALLQRQNEGEVASESQTQGCVSESVTYVTANKSTAETLIYDYLHSVKINGVPALYRGLE